MVQIKMKETRQASPDGVSIKQYDNGQTYTGATPHEVRLLESFVSRGFADYHAPNQPETKKIKVATPKNRK
jgi:hypothetical protein